MGTSRMDRYVQCPFYRQDDSRAQRIICEGLVEKSVISLTYQIKADYRIQLRTFCCKSYECCEIYRILMEKYEQ